MSHDLRERTRAFVDAFNRGDLDEVMTHFTDDAVYDEFTGKRNVGKTAVREAFEPQFRGDFGELFFDEEDLLVDTESRKALVSWVCRLKGRGGGWRGLDVLVFRNELVCEKRTYTKAAAPHVDRER